MCDCVSIARRFFLPQKLTSELMVRLDSELKSEVREWAPRNLAWARVPARPCDPHSVFDNPQRTFEGYSPPPSRPLQVLAWAAHFEHRLQSGQKSIIHLEAFVARFMSLYKQFLIAAFG